jgi:hypothetical protein
LQKIKIIFILIFLLITSCKGSPVEKTPEESSTPKVEDVEIYENGDTYNYEPTDSLSQDSDNGH